MNNLLIIWEILNLNLKKYKIITYKLIKKWILEFEIKSKIKSVLCPQCWFKTTKRQDLKEYKQKTNLKHINISNNKIIELKPIKRYFRCNNCNSNFLERFDIESNNWFHSIDFENYVIASWWYMSWNKIAEVNKCSVWKIYRILQDIDHTKINDVWINILSKLDEIYLWVDEHSFSWKDMILIITELKTKKLVAILDWITKDKLECWINSIPKETQMKIKWFSTDMNKGYKKSLEKIVSKPIFSVDKYHLFQEANKMVDEVRILNSWLVKMKFVKADEIIKLWKIPKRFTKKDIAKINKNSNKRWLSKYKNKCEHLIRYNSKIQFILDWEKIEYKEITLDYFLETWYRKLFLRREKNLTWLQKLRINQIFKEFDYLDYLKESRTIKEDFMDAIDNLDLKEIDRIILECRGSEHHRIKQFWRTLTNWYDWIKWFCEHSTKDFKFTNALTEGFNNSCKVAKRQSHWFKLKENYFRKIFTKIMLKNV